MDYSASKLLPIKLKNMHPILFLLILLPTVYIFVKFLEEFIYKQDTKGYIPDNINYHNIVTFYLKSCELLSDSTIYVNDPGKDIKYISCILKGVTYKWVIVGENHRYLVPRWSPLHKEIENRYKQLKYNKESKLF
jgi:hypothetical protein